MDVETALAGKLWLYLVPGIAAPREAGKHLRDAQGASTCLLDGADTFPNRTEVTLTGCALDWRVEFHVVVAQNHPRVRCHNLGMLLKSCECTEEFERRSCKNDNAFPGVSFPTRARTARR